MRSSLRRLRERLERARARPTALSTSSALPRLMRADRLLGGGIDDVERRRASTGSTHGRRCRTADRATWLCSFWIVDSQRYQLAAAASRDEWRSNASGWSAGVPARSVRGARRSAVLSLHRWRMSRAFSAPPCGRRRARRPALHRSNRRCADPQAGARASLPARCAERAGARCCHSTVGDCREHFCAARGRRRARRPALHRNQTDAIPSSRRTRSFGRADHYPPRAIAVATRARPMTRKIVPASQRLT